MSDRNDAGTFLAIVGRKEGHVACALPPTVQILILNVKCVKVLGRGALRDPGRENQVEKTR